MSDDPAPDWRGKPILDLALLLVILVTSEFSPLGLLYCVVLDRGYYHGGLATDVATLDAAGF